MNSKLLKTMDLSCQWRTGRDKILLRTFNMKKMFSGARFDVSISKNKRRQEVFTTTIRVAGLSFV